MCKVTTICAAAVIFALAGLASAAPVEYTVSGWGPTSFPGPHSVPYGAPHSPKSEGGDGWGYPGDAVGFVTYTGTLDLTPGTYVQKISTLSWSVSYTYNGTDDDWTNDGPPPKDWPELQFSIDGDRQISFVGGPTGTLYQTGILKTNWFDDALGVSEGSTSIFYVGGYRVDVTPLGLAETNVSFWDGKPPCIQPGRAIMARFEVTPEPATMALLALGGIGLLARRRRK